MKKVLAILLLLSILSVTTLFKSQKRQEKTVQVPSQREVEVKKAIFIPDWSLTIDQNPTSEVAEYGRWIYFGSVKNLPAFVKTSTGKEKWFTIKIDELEDEKNWPEIVQREINIAKDYNLQGIVLDLEINGLPTDDLVIGINNFVKYFYTEVKTHDIKLALAIYADTFARKRPYDIDTLAKNSDELMIMAYDFHKSLGEPGPNFPYKEFQPMIDDFLQFVPAEKLTVIFGMYGYDWAVDEKKRPITPARALTLNEIRKKFLTKCEWKDCIVKRDNLAKETEVDYTVSATTPDEQGIYRIDYHVVWFEDEESVKIKIQFLKKKGIGSVAYWAAGYF